MSAAADNFGHRRQAAHFAASQRRVTSSCGGSFRSVAFTSRRHAFLRIDQTPRHSPQVRQTRRMISSADEAIAGLAGAKGPAVWWVRNRRMADVSRSRHNRLILGFGACPSSTAASASIPGSCGTTISIPPQAGPAPHQEKANHTFSGLAQRYFAAHGRVKRNLSHSWHSAQPLRIKRAAASRSSSASRELRLTPSDETMGESCPSFRIASDRSRRCRQRLTARFERLRERKATACASTSALNKRNWSGGSEVTAAHGYAPLMKGATHRSVQTVPPIAKAA